MKFVFAVLIAIAGNASSADALKDVCELAGESLQRNAATLESVAEHMATTDRAVRVIAAANSGEKAAELNRKLTAASNEMLSIELKPHTSDLIEAIMRYKALCLN